MSAAPTVPRRRLRDAARVAPGARVFQRIPRAAALVASGWALLLVAWAFSNPPFESPDEPAHYLRAVAVGDGNLGATPSVEVSPRYWAVFRHPTGSVLKLGSRDGPCNVADQARSAACTSDFDPLPRRTAVETAAGGYPIPSYLLPGLALRAAPDVFWAVRFARLAGALVAFAFLAVALVLLVEPHSERLSLLGLLVTVTPMVLFVLSSVNASSLEIAAGIAFFGALLRLSRDTGPPPTWVWAAAAASGLTLGVTRATGALWIVLDAVLFLGLAGRRRTFALARGAPRAALVTAGLLTTGVVVNRVWEQLNGNEITQKGAAAAGGGAAPAFKDWYWHGFQQLRRVFDEEIGVFGWLDTVMPQAAYPAWQAMIAGIVVLALAVARRRERWILVSAIGLSFAVVVALSASLEATTGTDVQGRHVLPFAVVVPLLAGELVYRNRARLALVDLGALLAWLAAAVAVLQAVAWYANAYRQSVGINGPRFFLLDAEWSPPLGWLPWLLLAFTGAALLAAPALLWQVRRR